MLTRKERCALVLATTRPGFWTWNPQTGETDYCERWLEMLDYSTGAPGDYEEQLALIHPADRLSWDARMTAHLDQREPVVEMLLRMRSRGGDWVFVSSRGMVGARDARGRATRFCGVHSDLGATVEGSLLSAKRLNTRVLSRLSHKLRTPLNAILGLSEALSDHAYGPMAPRQRRSLQTIHQSGTRLLSILNDFIELSRAEAGQLAVELAPMSVAICARECLLHASVSADEKSVGVVVDLCPEDVMVSADRRRLRRALESLFLNALSAAARGSTIRVWAEPSADRTRVELGVSVDEPVVAAEELMRMLDPSAYLDARSRPGDDAFELALPLAKHLIELQGGRLSAREERGGLHVQIALRACETGSSAGVSVETRAAASPAPATQHGAEILVVEDDDTNALVLTQYLAAKGFCSRLARDGAQAIEVVAGGEVALVLMDLGLPGIDGLEATRRIRASERASSRQRTPVVLLTGSDSDEIRRACVEVGVSLHLVKPIPLRKLVAAISPLLPGGGGDEPRG